MTNRVVRFCVWLVMLFVVTARGDEWLLLPEPKFMEHKVARPITGAKATVLAVAKLGEFGSEFWKQFEEIFGAKMLVVMANRNAVFSPPQ